MRLLKKFMASLVGVVEVNARLMLAPIQQLPQCLAQHCLLCFGSISGLLPCVPCSSQLPIQQLPQCLAQHCLLCLGSISGVRVRVGVTHGCLRSFGSISG